MAEHWCKEHQMTWFKKGKMKGYAHPILDEDGEPTGEWCNEPKSEIKEKPASPTYKGRDEDKVDRRTFVMEIGEDWRAGKRKDNDVLVITREAYLTDWANGSLKGGKDVSIKIPAEKTGRDTREGLGQGDREGGEFDEEWWLKSLETINDKRWIAEQLKTLGVTVKQGQGYIKAIKAMDSGKQALLKNEVRAKMDRIELDDIPF